MAKGAGCGRPAAQRHEMGRWPTSSGSWAGLMPIGGVIRVPSSAAAARHAAREENEHLARGNLRSYSDVGLCSGGATIDMRRLDRFLAADWETGVVTVEAGMTLQALSELTVQHGWFPKVAPGTGMVTIGGAVANDVHGKNHDREGSFGCHVLSMNLARSDAPEPIQVSPGDGLYHATVGGLGLTGAITDLTLQLGRVPSSALQVERRAFRGLNGYLALESSGADWEHRVAWLDLTTPGEIRGVYCRGNWARNRRCPPRPRQRSVPLSAPISLVTSLSSRAANLAMSTGRRRGNTVEHYSKCLHPLDAWARWNSLWGPRGFRQYQCVIGADQAEVLQAIVENIQGSGLASPLVVLKRFGPRTSPGMLSFPREGFTLAVDFPNSRKVLEELFPALDVLVASAGGALYPAKDARIPRDLLEQSFPRLGEFAAFRDPAIHSDFSRRYGL